MAEQSLTRTSHAGFSGSFLGLLPDLRSFRVYFFATWRIILQIYRRLGRMNFPEDRCGMNLPAAR